MFESFATRTWCVARRKPLEFSGFSAVESCTNAPIVTVASALAFRSSCADTSTAIG
jgi:hypothetical protein